ncbi:redoxin domain-containing protein [Limnoglobus roseus]|uniref:Alkyl hydroperoxide reductase n=1 Tax=Limnoglobus roseus TaxID=2598579 RepID=A0A5C1A851_9BACT|nr:redoxin domain-containing protein [Limnoglobus roseus]QEL14427.1 alkyl hydroperoxide reductase [Limnoglobus roseus]
MRCALLVLLTLSAIPLSAAEPGPPLGTKIADFTLTDAATGKAWGLVENTRDAKAVVVLFPTTGCPVSLAYVPVVQQMAKKYEAEGVKFVAVYSHESDDAATIAKQAKNFALSYPVLKDDGTKVADKFNVDRVPTAFVLDATRTVRYQGRIDDQFTPGVHKPKATTRELGNAIDAVLEGSDVKVTQTAASGCKLTREKSPVKAGEPVTYTKQVSRILQAKCLECHRAGEAAPFALDSYKSAKSWSAMMREVVADDIMPPWHADAKFGHFKNDRRLTAEDKATLLAWIDQGCVEGDAKDLPAPRTFLDGWRLPRDPDEVLKLKKPISIPANSFLGIGVPYQYVPVGEKFAEDKWIEAVEVRPEYRAVVHHIICFIIPPGGSLLDVMGPDFGSHMLGAYVPGDAPTVLPKDHARKILKGSQLMFEMHYTPNGQAGKDQSMIGICYAKGPPKHEIQNRSILNGKFQIPPGADNYEVKSSHTLKKAVTVYSFTPHMHVRGKAFKFELVSPDGSREVLCNIPKYDFNWQANYELAKPRDIPAGSKIECTAWYDNSDKNPTNPDPTSKVRWGNQTWQEMMIGFVVYTEKD